MTRGSGLPPARLLAGSLALTALLSVCLANSRVDAATIHVPADYATIQGAVDAAAPNDLILVAAGTYVEQVAVVAKPLTIRGAGIGATIVQSPPGTLPVSYATPTVNRPVLSTQGPGDLIVEDLTIDGAGNGNANLPRFVGLGFRNAGGRATNVRITGVRNAVLDGDFVHMGVNATNNTGGPFLIELGFVQVDDYQSTGLHLLSNGLTVDVHDCRIIGAGPQAVQVQNGIQIGFPGLPVSGSVRRTRIEGQYYTPFSASRGLLLLGEGSVSVSEMTGPNAFGLVNIALLSQGVSTAIDGFEVDAASGASQGITIENQSSFKIVRPGQDGERENSGPYMLGEGDDPGAGGQAPKGPTTNYAMTCSITNACLTGSDLPGSTGIQLLAYPQPLIADITNCTVQDWEYGIQFAGSYVTCSPRNCAFLSNLTAGFDDIFTPGPNDVTSNWWGHASGPSLNGPGSGDPIRTVNAVFTPWLPDGTDSNPGLCGFQPANNIVAAQSPGSCISTATPCVTVPVGITRVDAAQMRGYSITFQLSPELVLCSSPAGSIPGGSYLPSAAGLNGTQRFVTDNGGGSYTVDETILGTPCGATASSGMLFSIQVKASGGGDGTGTITLTDVTLRDCSNLTILSEAGAPLAIPIDQTVPDAIATLDALQQTSGNDGDGTTKVNLSWAASEAGSTVGIYRKGFGFYPEYDDAGGAVPPTPLSPGAAVSDGWTLAASLPSPVTSYLDELASPRDFYYYVVFVTDGCGNVSAVSNSTGGSLNYHLGDVSDGFVAGQGDNLVSTPDISLLGASYGLTGGAVTPVNYLDVGPTTDFSVTTRPTTDDRINFEDLILFAINYGEVSAPDVLVEGPAGGAGRDELALAVEGSTALGGELTARVTLAGSGRVQGLSVPLTWNARVVEPIGFAEGEFLRRMNGIALSPAPGTVDVALLGARARGFAAAGEIASVKFRVIGAGDPGIALGEVLARDASNRVLDLAHSTIATDARPAATSLMPATPNPMRGATALEFALARPGHVELAICSVDGRRLRTLVNEQRATGFHHVTWNGADDAGRRLAPGVYYATFTTAEGRQSRTIAVIR